MKITKFLTICLILFCLSNETYLNGQVDIGVFSYSELFYSPNKSYGELNSFYSGSNKSHFSSHLGISVNYRISQRFSISVGLQRVNRQFDCDCVNVLISKSNFYYVSDDTCVLKSTSKDKRWLMPISVRYLFPSQNKRIIHAIGLGNTIAYSLGREYFLYDNLGSLNIKAEREFITFFAPEIYYELDVRLSKRTSANLSLGIREEITKQVNHAFFGKLGVGYLFGKMPKSKRKRK